MTDNMKIAMTAINKWVYYSLNYNVVEYISPYSGNIDYVPEFIPAINWTCPIEHMVDKWKTATRSEEPHAYFVSFYTYLDTQNRALFLDWVMNNYNDELKLNY